MSDSASRTVTLAELLSHAAWAQRLARSLTRDADDAEDLVQDTWIAANQHPPDTDRPLRPWLATVLRNLRRKRLLSDRRREARQATVPAPVPLSPEALVEKVEAQRALAELVTALDEPLRQTVILRFFEELTSAEIARRFGVPAGTVRWRLKTALAQLRARLDAQHGGKRERWLAVLTPLAPGRPAQRWPLTATLGTLGAAAMIVLGWRALAPASGGPAVAMDPARARPTAAGAVLTRGGPGRAQPGAVALAADRRACARELEPLRVELARVETKRRERLPGRELFAFGQANPEAEQALRPAIARLLGAGAPVHALECRTWACRLLVTQTLEQAGQTNEWQLPMQRDPELLERTQGMGFSAGTPAKDALSGAGLEEKQIFLKLADPTGKRVPRPRAPAPEPARTQAMASATTAPCRDDGRALRLAIRAAERDIEKYTLPSERFENGQPDAKLAADFRARLLSKFPGPQGGGLAVECRASICRAVWKDAPGNWYNGYHREPWFRQMVDGMMVGHDTHFVMAAGPRADGLGFLMQLMDRFQASRLPDDCAARFPAQGTLKVKLHLPKTGEPNEEGDLGRIFAVYGDALAGTPLANCLAEAIAREVLAAPLPALPVGEATLGRRFTFPREPGVSASPR